MRFTPVSPSEETTARGTEPTELFLAHGKELIYVPGPIRSMPQLRVRSIAHGIAVHTQDRYRVQHTATMHVHASDNHMRLHTHPLDASVARIYSMQTETQHALA